jgi:hypothetical protein
MGMNERSVKGRRTAMNPFDSLSLDNPRLDFLDEPTDVLTWKIDIHEILDALRAVN